MLAGTQVLWEEKLSYYDLMVMRVSEGEASFNSEEQNEPINPDDCLFMEEWVDYYNEAEADFCDPAFDFFGFIDPSLGKTRRSDFSAIVTLARHRASGYMLSLIHILAVKTPEQRQAEQVKKYVDEYAALSLEAEQMCIRDSLHPTVIWMVGTLQNGEHLF